jgi:hypothetical protein
VSALQTAPIVSDFVGGATATAGSLIRPGT